MSETPVGSWATRAISWFKWWFYERCWAYCVWCWDPTADPDDAEICESEQGKQKRVPKARGGQEDGEA